MVVRILSSVAKNKLVSADLIVETIERNRDRIRTIGNMLLTMSGILISAVFAFMIFLADKKLGAPSLGVLLAFASFLFLLSACLSILSSFLRTRYMISSELQFIADLLKLYHSELRLLRFSFVSLVAGLMTIAAAALTFLSKTAR